MDLMDLMSSLNDLIDYEFELTEDGHIPPSVLRWFNACSNDLTDAARYPGRATFDYIPTVGEITLPVDFYKPIPEGFLFFEGYPLPELDLRQNTRYGFRRWGRVLYLQGLTKEGTLSIYYYKKLPKFTGDPTEVPVIPARFQEAYALFAAMRFMQFERDEMDSKADFHGEYEMMKRDLDIYTMSQDTAPYPTIRDAEKIRYSNSEWEDEI